MCRKKDHLICTELGPDSNQWSRHCPLPPPAWFDSELDVFAEAVRSAATGDVSNARLVLSRVRDADLRDWYIVHGQNSGRSRHDHFQRPRSPTGSTDSLRSPKRFEAETFARDGYRCRYCSTRVVPNQVMKAFQAVVGCAAFPMGSKNENRHGVVLAFSPVADHVVDWSIGGRTHPSNLVTACWSCNYGKYWYSLDQLAIDDPRDRAPIRDEWDGLLPLVTVLSAIANG